jgi:protein ImuA
MWVFYIDTGGDFYPPAAAQLGLSLERLLVIRTQRTADALWVCEQALRCKAIAAVVLPIRTVDARVSRRLQLAAETGGGLGFLLRSELRGGHTFAATRLRLDPVPNKNPSLCRAEHGASVHLQSDPPLSTATEVVLRLLVS